jgi:hypothetical protein
MNRSAQRIRIPAILLVAAGLAGWAPVAAGKPAPPDDGFIHSIAPEGTLSARFSIDAEVGWNLRYLVDATSAI